MLAPNDFVSAAARIFAAANPGTAARADNLEIRQVRTAASGGWRLLHQEIAPPAPVMPPLFGDAPAMPERQALPTRVWAAREVRLVGRRGLLAKNGALFLGGPVRDEADLARAAANCVDGGEGLMLDPGKAGEARLLSRFANGERRLTGVGLHLGTAVNGNAKPFMLDQFAALLLIAELRPRIDYVVLADADPDLARLLADVGLAGLKIFDLAQLQGVTCGELLVPVIAQDPAGWVDGFTVGRLRRFAADALAKLGPGVHAAPARVFLTDFDGSDRPLNRLAQQQGYVLRGLVDRGIVDQALMVAKASEIVTDQPEGALASLFARADVPVLDLAGGDPTARVPLLAGTGRAYGIATEERAEEALAALARHAVSPQEQAAA